MSEDDAAITADDWGAAMSEQTTAEESGTEESGADDWAAAMAEQETPAPVAENHVFEKFGESAGNTTHTDLEMILDIPVQLTVELGRTKMPIKNLLQLAQGSVVELSGMAGEPLDVMINGFLIAQGEVVVVNDKLGIRLTDIITPSERLRRVNR
ncbi:MAG: flagellar motor switch protein FliN [Gallionella sp.]